MKNTIGNKGCCRDRMQSLLQRCEFEPRSGEVYLIQHYVIKFVSDGSVVFSGYSGFLHKYN